MDSKNLKKKLNIFYIGLTGEGKSSLINSIANENLSKAQNFESLNGVTKTISEYKKIINNIQFTFYDTPGFQDQNVNLYDLFEQIQELMKKDDFLIDYIVLVAKSTNDRMFDFLKDYFGFIKEFFKENINSNLICVLTFERDFNSRYKGEDIENKKQSLITYLIDNLRTKMEFEIYPQNFLFSDINSPEKEIFQDKFFNLLQQDLNPLKMKNEKELNFKNLNCYLNSIFERNELSKRLIKGVERINLEKVNMYKDKHKSVKIKITLTGAPYSGKTSMFYYLKYKSFLPTPNSISTDIFTINYVNDELKKHFEVKVTDIPGQEQFHSFVSTPIKEADIILILFDLEDIEFSKNEFDDYLKNFIKDLRQQQSHLIIFFTKKDTMKGKKDKEILEIERQMRKIVNDLKDFYGVNSDLEHYMISVKEDQRDFLDEILQRNLHLFENKPTNNNKTLTKDPNPIPQGYGCFSKEMTVKYEQDNIIKVGELTKSDTLLTLKCENIKQNGGHNDFTYQEKSFNIKKSKFVTFLHKEQNRKSLFMKILVESSSSDDFIVISHDHLIFSKKNSALLVECQSKSKDVNESFIKAGSLREGDYLLKYIKSKNEEEKLEWKKIIKIESIEEEGVYAPLTEDGTILVNDFYVSCYASINSHKIAHWSMKPLILGSKLGLFNEKVEGVHPFCKTLTWLNDKLKIVD